MTCEDLPALNAILNGSSALLLAAGYAAIRRKRVAIHRLLMTTAFGVSAAFLVSYLTHKFTVKLEPFSGTGSIRPVYFTILITHTILAALIVPLALATLVKGYRGRHPSHERFARWTLPIWFYVSVTGVVIYFIRFRMYPS